MAVGALVALMVGWVGSGKDDDDGKMMYIFNVRVRGIFGCWFSVVGCWFSYEWGVGERAEK